METCYRVKCSYTSQGRVQLNVLKGLKGDSKFYLVHKIGLKGDSKNS